MSTKANHRKRSHRSEYRKRGYTGSRMAPITPTLHKQHIMDLIHMIRMDRARRKIINVKRQLEAMAPGTEGGNG